MRLLASIFLGILLSSFSVSAQEVPLIKTEQLLAWKNSTADSTYVINFWATWCAPCVKELPYFDSLQTTHADQNLEVILVSTDFKRNLENRVKPFVKDRKIISTVVFIDESNPNNFIDLVSPEWSGAIPATLIVSGKTGKSVFHEGELDYEALITLVKEVNQKP